MRYVLCAALFCGLLGAQDNASGSSSSYQGDGVFYVNGIAYHFLSGSDYTVVVAAHSIANRKFLAVKLRIVNDGQHSVTVRPNDVRVVDAVAEHDLEQIPGAELAKRMRRPYNWSRFGVNAAGGPPNDTGDDSQTSDPQHSDILRAMQQMAMQMASAPPVISALSIADTTGIRQPEASVIPEATISDEVSHLRMKEAARPDVLMRLQRQSLQIIWRELRSWPIQFRLGQTWRAFFTIRSESWFARPPHPRNRRNLEWCESPFRLETSDSSSSLL